MLEPVSYRNKLDWPKHFAIMQSFMVFLFLPLRIESF